MPPAVYHFLKGQFKKLPYPDTSFTGQTCIVTGANVGLGLEAARHLTRLNAAKVILAVRSTEKGAEAQRSIEQSTSRTGIVEVWPLDLSDSASVRAFVERAKALSRIDVLLENAGVVHRAWTTSGEGSEMTMAVNVYGTFLLALLMLPILRRCAKEHGIIPRLTVVTSMAHHLTPFTEGQEEDVLTVLDDESRFNSEDRYNVSKLLQVFYVRELAARLNPVIDGVIVNMVNPGLCHSSMDRGMGPAERKKFGRMKALLARTTEVGSRTLVHAAAAGPASHGMYADSCEFLDAALSRRVRSKDGLAMQKKMFELVTDRLNTIQPGVLNNALA
jgi:retinol dehydrogenase 12